MLVGWFSCVDYLLQCERSQLRTLSCYYLASTLMTNSVNAVSTFWLHPGGKVLNGSGKAEAAPSNCEEDRGGCEHMCHMEDDNINCTCFRGFRLNPDAKTCTGNLNRASNFKTDKSIDIVFILLHWLWSALSLDHFKMSICNIEWNYAVMVSCLIISGWKLSPVVFYH